MRKTIFICSLLLLSTLAQGKFAMSVFDSPCEEIELEITNCREYIISNKSDLPIRLQSREDIVFAKKGALVSANILNRRAIKCHKKQKVNLKLYKPTELNSQVFINKLSCQKKLTIVKVLRLNFYCDTPGTATIFSCYINALERKKNFEYTSLK
jgi:hypothetical protein